MDKIRWMMKKVTSYLFALQSSFNTQVRMWGGVIGKGEDRVGGRPLTVQQQRDYLVIGIKYSGCVRLPKTGLASLGLASPGK